MLISGQVTMAYGLAMGWSSAPPPAYGPPMRTSYGVPRPQPAYLPYGGPAQWHGVGPSYGSHPVPTYPPPTYAGYGHETKKDKKHDDKHHEK